MGRFRELPNERCDLEDPSAAFKDRLGRMFDAHHDSVRRRVRRLGLSVDKADDAAAQAFLVAAERLDDIKTGSERAFLFGTALRVAQQLMRTERRWVLEGDMDVRFARSSTPEALAAHHRTVRLASQVIAAMDLDVRSTFTSFAFEGLTARQIADDAGVPLGTVASRLRRARVALRAALARGATDRGSPD
jgi:RNA polymerase sigma-70 factor (ECF subfamily)